MVKRSKSGGAISRSGAASSEKKNDSGSAKDVLPVSSLIPSSLNAFSWFHIAALALVVLSMTPLTHNLDDIKVTELFISGSILSAWGIWMMARGNLPVPSRFVGWGLGLYWFAMILSTILSDFGWAGWHEVIFTWASIGFFFGGMAAGSSWPMLKRFCDAAIILVCAVNLFGFFQYDVLGTGHTGMSYVYNMLYDKRMSSTAPSAMHSLFYTFASQATTRLMSTALNRDFYAAFCLLYFPLAVSFTLLTRNRLRIAVGISTALFTLISIFLCKSKGEYLFAAASAGLYLVLFVLAVRRIEINVRYVWAWLLGAAMVFLVFVWMNLPTLMIQLKDIRFSLSSREIIFAGAWGIFMDFPIWGGGPGTFKLYFPLHRRPDYFDHEISNVTELAHNYILNILSETGLAGGLTFGVFALSLAVLAFRMAFRADDNRLRLMLIAVLCGLFGMYGSNMTSTSGFWPIGAVGLWTFMGLLMGLVRQGEGWQAKTEIQSWARPVADTLAYGFSPARLKMLKQPAIAAGAISMLVATVLLPSGIWRGREYWLAARAYNQALLEFDRVSQLYSAQVNDPNLDSVRKAQLARVLLQAEDGFLRALAITPSHMSAYYKLGSVYNMLANMEPAKHEDYLGKAKSTYEQLYQYAPDYAEIHYNLGVVNYRLGRLTDKRIEIAKAAGNSEELEKLEAQRDEYNSQSQKFFERMKAMSDKPEVFLNLGDTYLQGGQFDEAQKILGEAMERYPDDARFVRSYYMASLRREDPAGQIRGMMGQWRLTPGNRQNLYIALKLALEQNETQLFAESVAAALERNPVDPIVHESIAREAQKRNDAPALAQAAENYARLASDPNMLRLLIEAGGVKDDVILAGAEAAETIGDKSLARRLYGFLTSQSTPSGEKARQWLQSNPG